MLRRLRIRNFRSCEDVTLDDMQGVTALIGRNGAGKSNVLKAIETLANLACATGPNHPVWSDMTFSRRIGHEPAVSFEAEFVAGGQAYRYEVEAAFRLTRRQDQPQYLHWMKESLTCVQEDGSVDQVFTRDGEDARIYLSGEALTLGAGVSALVAIGSLLPAEHAVQNSIRASYRYFRAIRYFPLDEPASPSPKESVFSEREYDRWKAMLSRTGEPGDSVALQLAYLSEFNSEVFLELKSQLGTRGLRLIEDISIHKSGDDANPDFNLHLVLFRLPSISHSRTFSTLSQGTRRMIRLLTGMAFRGNSLLLIEHPEDGIHKGLVRKLGIMLDTEVCDAQVILSTHSDTLVNEMRSECIRFVSMEDGTTRVRALSPEEREAASGYINSDAEGTLAEFLHAVED